VRASVPVLRVRDVTKRYGSNFALVDFDLDAHAGQLTTIVGPNGSGKTTAVEIIEGLRAPDSGTVEMFGTELGRRRRPPGVGVQLQEESLPTRIKVREAIDLYSYVAELPEPPRDLIKILGLEPFWDAPFVSLSGGQKRRVVLALAALGAPRLLILDEPTSGLDPAGQQAVEQLVRTLLTSGTAILATMHDMAAAERLSDMVVMLRKGRIFRSGPPRELINELGTPTVLTLPAAVDISPEDSRRLGIMRSLTVNDRVNYFGGADLAARLREWRNIDAFLERGYRGIEIRPASLLDVYLAQLDTDGVADVLAEMVTEVQA
jgi:ABC-2 type transport system ATP-binding protein